MVELLLKMQVTEVNIKFLLLSLCLYCTSQHNTKYIPIVFLLYIITKCCCGYDIYYVHTLLSVKYMKCKIIYNQNSNIILISIGIYCSEYIKQLTIIIIEAFKLKYLNRDYWNVIFITSV
jgi:hypothetical protein